jgi:hypothetical protein
MNNNLLAKEVRKLNKSAEAGLGRKAQGMGFTEDRKPYMGSTCLDI